MQRDPFSLYRDGRVRPAPDDNADVGADASATRGVEGVDAARKEDKSAKESGTRGGTGRASDSPQKPGDSPNPDFCSRHSREILV